MQHRLQGNAATQRVYLDGKALDIRPSMRHHKHAGEFNWGYGGSGPAQLALAVMLKCTGSPTGYQDFKFKTIAALPQGQDFDITIDL